MEGVKPEISDAIVVDPFDGQGISRAGLACFQAVADAAVDVVLVEDAADRDADSDLDVGQQRDRGTAIIDADAC